MYIDCVVNSGKPYLRVAESYTVREKGVRKNKKRTIRNIGPMWRFDDGEPDFLGRLKRSFKEGRPLVPGLEDLIDDKPARKFTVKFDRDSETDRYSAPLNCGYFVPDGLYDLLGIYDVLNRHKSDQGLDIDLNGLSLRESLYRGLYHGLCSFASASSVKSISERVLQNPGENRSVPSGVFK